MVGTGGRYLTPDRIGGLAALLIALGYVVTMPLFAMVGAPPEGTVERLEYHASGTAAWWAIVVLSIATDLLFVPLAVVLTTTARSADRVWTAIGAAFIALFVVLDLAVLWPAKVAMVTLGRAAATATDDGRDRLVAAAGYPAAVLDSDLVAIYSVLTVGIGILVIGLVDVRAPARRVSGFVGATTGAVALASVIEGATTGAFPILVVVASLLTIVWLVLVGWRLVRLPTSEPAATVRGPRPA